MADSTVDDIETDQGDEMEAEADSDQEQDIDQVLGAWLGELENMTKQMDSDIVDANLPTSPMPQPSYDILDNFRFSQFNLETSKSLQAFEDEDSQDVDLDALLGDLCEMEQSLQEQIWKGSQPTTKTEAVSTVSDSMSTSSHEAAPPPPPPPPPPPGDEQGSAFIDDLPPPPPEEDSLIESDSAPLPPPPPSMDTENGESMPAPPPPPPPPPPPLSLSSKPVPQSLPLSVSPSNSSTTISESTHDDTASLDSTRTASTHSLPSPRQATEPQFQAVTTQMPFLEVTPSSPAPVPTSPRSPSSPSFQPPPANLSKSVRVKLKEIEDQLENDPSLSEEERQSKIKSEKIKIALEKLKKANIQKLIVRVFTDDGSSKTVFLDETMSCRGVTSMMIEKNHLEYKPMLAILEQVPDLYMERIVEDHENLVNDVLLNWKRETTSRILFSERKEKYGIFKNPQNYLLSTSSSQAAQQFAEKSKEVLIKEFFSDTGSQIPEVDGVLWMKAEGKKSWKRFYFILRASGLYFSPKGKSKSSKDLVCLVGFEHNHVYHGVSWKKKYKAPTDHCFAIKHPQLQQKSKYIKYLCAEDYRSCQRWIAGIRLAKYGRQLLLNYNQTQQELREYKVRHISETSSITNGMPDTISLSSMHSTVSSHSSSSGSLHDSRSSGRSSLSIYQPTQVLPLQANAPIRRGTVGNMFANAWKKGLETDGKGSNATNSNGNFIQSPTSNENTELHRPAIVTPTKSKRPSQTLNEFEVQRALQELDMELDMSNDKDNESG
ncbi:uncharacterized protein [Apostichopus japonicus]|uniref:uncharacterized protein isoform X2 n=1 Tax=Stichopus japonicus TaxID=307972 RepID=UPI003AB90ECE